MMKKFLNIHFLLFFSAACWAQEARLTGKVVNQSKAPVEFAYASLLKNDSVPVSQAGTDSLGFFIINAVKGNYRLIIERFGNRLADTQVVLDKDTDLGILEINESTGLQEVIISTRKKLLEQKADRLVFNVEKLTSVTGGTALDVLKATPTVRVQNDNISIAGKGGVLVMIDDRPQRLSAEDLANFLKSLPADNIKSIEVITTPPARYDAEGNSGLINIKLKTAKADSWDASLTATYRQRTYGGGNVAGSFQYNYGKLSFTAAFNTGIQRYLTTSQSRTYYPGSLWQSLIKDRSRSVGSGIDLSAGCQVSKRWRTGIKYLGNFTSERSANNPVTARFNTAEAAAGSYIASVVNATGSPNMHSLNWYHAIDLDSSGKKITADIDYFNYRKKDYRFFSGNELDRDRVIIPGTFFSSANTNINKVSNYSGKIDVVLPYNKTNISFGGKAAYTHTGNNLVVYDHSTGVPVLNTGQSNVFNYKEYNEALYFSAGTKINTQWEMQAGLRMEATQTEGYSQNLDRVNKNNYIQFFPTAYLTYVPGDKNSFSLSYSRRIRRPDFDYLNPFIIRTSPYFYSEGNPLLKPSFMNNLEFGYIRDQKWASSLYYAQVTDFGQELAIADAATNVTKQTPLNYANTYQLGFSTYYNFNKWSWWSSVSGFNANYQYVRSKTAFIASVGGFNGYIYSNNDITLNKSGSLFLGVNYALQLPGRYQVFHISTMHMLDISIKLLLADKKLSLTLAAEDLLNEQRPLIAYNTNGIKSDVRNYGDTRGFRVSLSYRFGRSNLNTEQRNPGNEEERGRIR